MSFLLNFAIAFCLGAFFGDWRRGRIERERREQSET